MTTVNTITFEIVGEKMLLMHNIRLANPRDPIVREMKKITAKKSKKTDEDLDALAQLEWRGGLYYDEELGPYIPAEMIEASIREAAKATRRGKDVSRGIRCIEDKIALQYNGPRDPEALWNEGDEYIDCRAVNVSGKRVMRHRARFAPGWKLRFTISFLDSIFNREDVIDLVEKAGALSGIGDFRQRYGRFTSKVVAGAVKKAA